MIEKADVKNDELVNCLINVIRRSHKTIADNFNLNAENAPGHGSFITKEKLLRDYQKKHYYYYKENEIIIACVVLEKSRNLKEYYLRHLSVLPEYRHKGAGKLLVNYLIDQVKLLNGEKLSLGLINENELLKSWYQNLGFKKLNTKEFKHLPFSVCFMEYLILNL